MRRHSVSADRDSGIWKSVGHRGGHSHGVSVTYGYIPFGSSRLGSSWKVLGTDFVCGNGIACYARF